MAEDNGTKVEEKPEKKGKRLEQGHLPGMAPKKNVKVHNRALKYVEIRDERMGLTRKEVDAKRELLACMHDEGLTEYVHGDLSVNVNTKELVKVKLASAELPEEDDE